MADIPALKIEALAPGSRRDEAIETASEFVRLSYGYWCGRTATSAWLLTLGVLSLILLGILMQVGINQWSALFFNAIEQKSTRQLLEALQLILALALLMGVSGAAYVQVKMRLQVRWRQWLSVALVDPPAK